MKQLVYRIAEKFFPNGIERQISGVRLRLPFRYSRYYPADYEVEHIRFFREHIQPGDIVLDIGAQMGLMTKIFCELTGDQGHVYAFEPTPPTYQVLCETIRINAIGHIAEAVQKAVSDKKGKTTFFISDQALDPANSLVNYSRQHETGGIEVDLISVDEFCAERSLPGIHFIKIDAEGAEYAVLKGASESIKRFRPLIHLALHPAALKHFNSSLKEIYNFVVSNNYVVLYKSQHMTENEFMDMQELFDVELLPKKS